MKEKATRDDAVRLDKWLWAARFYKTRALAREMIDGGKVHYNGQRGKPSKIVELNAELKLRQGNEERTVIVLALTSQRRGAGAQDERVDHAASGPSSGQKGAARPDEI
ncbi:Heat shock protein 15 [Serratia marcescens]|nr:Heat shock protein 15 [Serratia marcescens]